MLSLTWPAYMQIYWGKGKRLHMKGLVWDTNMAAVTSCEKKRGLVSITIKAMRLKNYLPLRGVMNGPLKFLTARKILPLLDLLAKFKRVLACSCSPNFCVARKLAKQVFYFCSCSQKNRSTRHARECSQRPSSSPLLRI